LGGRHPFAGRGGPPVGVERDENTERKALLPTELVSLGRALEEGTPEEGGLKELARERRVEGNRIGGMGGREQVTGLKSTDLPEGSGRVREEVGGALGVGHASD
jgi:hypothetical protein